MRILGAISSIVLVLVGCAAARRITVAADGTGDYKTIQAAVDSVPGNNQDRVIISIRNGTYSETVRINNSFITLRGQDRKQTRIEAAIDTSACAAPPGVSKEEYCATVIADGHDLLFEDLTVVNTNKGRGKGAALSVVGNATRVLITRTDVVGYSGDTLVLSARRARIGDGAEYYLNDVYVSGTYHIIVPRGTTYAVNCTFWCMGRGDNCLFNEGITRETDKLVIRSSVIDGPEPFRLGSYFRDAAWYFIDNTISNKLRPDGQIQREPANDYAMKWGEGRIYFAGNKAPPYPWTTDNLDTSPVKTKNAVTAAWTLPQWDPEATTSPTVTKAQINANSIQLTFSESVTVEGQPVLLLKSGAAAAYAGGSGSTKLVFLAPRPAPPERIVLNGGLVFASAASLSHRGAKLSKLQ